MVIVVMGVSGSGKSTVGAALARAAGWDFQEGDALHPPANIAKLASGQPLDDADRAPWLERVADWIATQQRSGRHSVIACSALKHGYRDRLRRADPNMHFVYLRVAPDRLRQRLEQRVHFMPAVLLESQLSTLEEPSADEHALTLSGDELPDRIVPLVRQWLGSLPPRGS